MIHNEVQFYDMMVNLQIRWNQEPIGEVNFDNKMESGFVKSRYDLYSTYHIVLLRQISLISCIC